MAITLSVVLLAGLSAGEISWPPSLSVKLDRLIDIQRNARLTRGDENRTAFDYNVTRKGFDDLLSNVGSSQELRALKPLMQQKEGVELKAKLGLMALDFAQNRAAYELSGLLYVYRPRGKEEWDQFLQAKYPGIDDKIRLLPPGLFPAVIHAIPLKPEHAQEAFRLAFEYHLLAPINRPFFEESWFVLRKTLASIGNPATTLTYRELASSCPEGIRQGTELLIDHVVQGLCDFPSEASLDAIANLTEGGGIGNNPAALRAKALEFIGGTWGTYGLDAETFESDARNYKKWQALFASLPKGASNAKREPLARAIALLPTPPKPGPTDPFAPRNRPSTIAPSDKR